MSWHPEWGIQDYKAKGLTSSYPTVWDGIRHEPCHACGGEHHYWDCEIYNIQQDEIWLASRGATTGRRPILWCCSGCLYSFWSHDTEQDPDGDGHCSAGHWVADSRAIEVLGSVRVAE